MGEPPDPTLATRDSLARAAATRRAIRWAAWTAALTAVPVYAAGAALRFDLVSTTVSYVTFAALFAPTAGFLGLEVTRYRRCPRCGWQQDRRAGGCPDCGYDVARRPTWMCSEGHRGFEAGICACGRRRNPVEPVDVRGPVLRALWVGAAVLVALLVTGWLAG